MFVSFVSFISYMCHIGITNFNIIVGDFVSYTTSVPVVL